MKIKLEINKPQAHLIIQALDLYSRIGIGQFKTIIDHPTFMSRDRCDRSDELEILLTKARNILIGKEMPKNASYGIRHKDVHRSSGEAYDMLQIIRHEIWKNDPNRNMAVVSAHVHTETNVENIKCEIEG